VQELVRPSGHFTETFDRFASRLARPALLIL
jgi:hypothetical protein